MPGDTVELRTGGPLMTVAIAERDTVTCNWFDDRGHVQCYTFRREVLFKASCPYAPRPEPQAYRTASVDYTDPAINAASGYRD